MVSPIPQRRQQLVVNAAEITVAHHHHGISGLRFCSDIGHQCGQVVVNMHALTQRRQCAVRIPAQIGTRVDKNKICAAQEA